MGLIPVEHAQLGQAKTASRPMEMRPKDSKVFQDSVLIASVKKHTPSTRVCSETRGRQYYLDGDSHNTTLAR